jgi:hypothetical protein
VPLLAVLSLGAAFGLFVVSDDDLISRFGNRTPWSLGFFALTIVFSVLSVWGAFAAFSLPRGTGNRWARAHARLVAAANLVANSYLSYWGIVGFEPGSDGADDQCVCPDLVATGRWFRRP